MSHSPHDLVARELFEELSRWPIFDPHSHIDPRRPAARRFEEILGYHYYTELAHSAGMPSELVGAAVEPDTRARHLGDYLDRLDNTVQYSWLLEIARTFHAVEAPRISSATIEDLLTRADHEADGQRWDETVWQRTNLEAVFLTNDFDDVLDDWDTSRYVPCLRTDDLVLKLHEQRTLERLQKATNVDVRDAHSLRLALVALFEYFVEHGARACAISLPPDFQPFGPSPKRAVTPIRRALHQMELRPDEHVEIRTFVFWTLAELCAEFRLPFDLMIGPIRNVYPAGVAGGRDLFDRRVSLYDYRELFNHFSNVTFPVSTLAPDAGAELVAYGWIFPNVVPMGHWWYSNIPAYIANDLRARLQAVPKTKQVGYYSDAYKLEFILPKFNMYRRILAETLSEAVERRDWTMDRALELARLILLDNPRRIFDAPGARTRSVT
jgi:glucuronate isomerase